MHLVIALQNSSCWSEATRYMLCLSSSPAMICFVVAPMHCRIRQMVNCYVMWDSTRRCRWQEACMERDTAREVGQEQLTVISELQVRLDICSDVS